VRKNERWNPANKISGMICGMKSCFEIINRCEIKRRKGKIILKKEVALKMSLDSDISQLKLLRGQFSLASNDINSSTTELMRFRKC
jgi:hypothetical protein